MSDYKIINTNFTGCLRVNNINSENGISLSVLNEALLGSMPQRESPEQKAFRECLNAIKTDGKEYPGLRDAEVYTQALNDPNSPLSQILKSSINLKLEGSNYARIAVITALLSTVIQRQVFDQVCELCGINKNSLPIDYDSSKDWGENSDLINLAAKIHDGYITTSDLKESFKSIQTSLNSNQGTKECFSEVCKKLLEKVPNDVSCVKRVDNFNTLLGNFEDSKSLAKKIVFDSMSYTNCPTSMNRVVGVALAIKKYATEQGIKIINCFEPGSGPGHLLAHALQDPKFASRECIFPDTLKDGDITQDNFEELLEKYHIECRYCASYDRIDLNVDRRFVRNLWTRLADSDREAVCNTFVKADARDKQYNLALIPDKNGNIPTNHIMSTFTGDVTNGQALYDQISKTVENDRDALIVISSSYFEYQLTDEARHTLYEWYYRISEMVKSKGGRIVFVTQGGLPDLYDQDGNKKNHNEDINRQEDVIACTDYVLIIDNFRKDEEGRVVYNVTPTIRIAGDKINRLDWVKSDDPFFGTYISMVN